MGKKKESKKPFNQEKLLVFGVDIFWKGKIKLYTN